MSRKECYFAEEDERSRDPFRDEDVEFMHLRKDRPRRLFDEETGRPLNCNQVFFNWMITPFFPHM